MTDGLTRRIVQNGIVAAIYFLLTVVSTPFSYGLLQIRVAEAMVLLCFFRRDYVAGVTIGCLLANMNSSLGPWDILIGTSATFISSLLIAFASPRLLFACVFPIAGNAFVVGYELSWLLGLPFWSSVAYVAIGETIAVFFGYVFFMSVGKRPGFLAAVGADRHLDFRY